MRKKNKKNLPRLSTIQQVKMWNKVYESGDKELMSQRERRTAFAIKRRMGIDPINLKPRIRIEEYDNGVEIIFFSKEFALQIGALVFDKFSHFE